MRITIDSEYIDTLAEGQRPQAVVDILGSVSVDMAVALREGRKAGTTRISDHMVADWQVDT